MDDLLEQEKTRDLMKRRVEMMEHPAWKELAEDWGTIKNSMASVEGIENENQFWMNKGAVNILNLMLNLEGLTKQTLDSMDDL